MPPRPPTWIQRFYYFSCGLALLTTLWAVFGGTGQPPLASRPIADLTVNLNGQPVREHCTTCHPQGGQADPAAFGQVVSQHPDIAPHLTETLGCTGCHLGEGMALDLRISHGLPGYGARQVLAGADTRASCYGCHRLAPLPGAEPAWQGYRLFVTKGCSSCHQVAGLGRGGYFGPDLSEIGSLLGLEQLQEAIREPQLKPPNSIMPRFPLSKSQARKLAYFLKSRISNPAYATPMQLRAGAIGLPDIDPLPEGRHFSPDEALLYRGQCLACHKYRDQDGRIAPDLTYIGRLRDATYLQQFLDNPTSRIPDARMPRSTLTPAEDKQLRAFLGSDAIGPVDHAMTTPADSELQAPIGKMLYMQLCQRCHAAEGDGRGPIQPNLANFPRSFADNAEYFRNRSADQLQRSVGQGIPGTSMPGYGQLLDQNQRDQVLNLVFTAFIGIDQTEKTPPEPLPERPRTLLNQQQRVVLFEQLCADCHGQSGTGKGPTADELLPRPRNLRNYYYFAALDDQAIARVLAEGVAGTAMPRFVNQLNGQQLWSLVQQVRQFSATSGSSGD